MYRTCIAIAHSKPNADVTRRGLANAMRDAGAWALGANASTHARRSNATVSKTPRAAARRFRRLHSNERLRGRFHISFLLRGALGVLDLVQLSRLTLATPLPARQPWPLCGPLSALVRAGPEVTRPAARAPPPSWRQRYMRCSALPRPRPRPPMRGPPLPPLP